MAINKPVKGKWIGIIGFILAILSYFPYLGLLFIPAGIISIGCIVVFFRKSFPIIALIALMIAFIRSLGAMIQLPALPPSMPDFIHLAYANVAMYNYGFPSIPHTARNININAGGLFAKNIMLIFDAPESDVKNFMNRLGACEIRKIGPPDFKLMTYEMKAKAIDLAMSEDKVFDDSKISIVHTFEWLPWYRPDTIENGWFAAKDEGVITGYVLYYDVIRSRAFFNWHYD